MNYHHIFHAGSFADVFKHCILTLILESLCQKDKAFSYIDSHAGIGLYDLSSGEAQRSLEFENGIKKIMLDENPIPELKNYLQIVEEYQTSRELLFYPGSPLFAKHFLRADDHFILNEYHPDDFQKLKANVGRHSHIHLHQRDAYEFLPAILPPQHTRRALILIDPPYEKADEFNAIREVMKKCVKRFSQGIYMIWYPIVSQRYQTFVKQIINDQLGPTLIAELCLDKIYFAKTNLVGCGVILINPPWNIEKPVKNVSAYLWELFNGGRREGFFRVYRPAV